MSSGQWVLKHVLTAGVLSACIAKEPRGDALYPQTNPPIPREQVAQLSGYVQSVDGQDITKLRNTLEVLPGCHVVVTPKTWGKVEYNSAGVVLDTGHIQYSIPMQAGRAYEIRVEVLMQNGPSASSRVSAVERDSSGKYLRSFEPDTELTHQSPCGHLSTDTHLHSTPLVNAPPSAR